MRHQRQSRPWRIGAAQGGELRGQADIMAPLVGVLGEDFQNISAIIKTVTKFEYSTFL